MPPGAPAIERYPRATGRLLRRRWVWVTAAALALLGALGGLVPLLDVPGYELGLVGAWAGLGLAAPLALAAVRDERARADGSPVVAAVAAALAAAALLAALFLAVALRAALGPCRALDGAAFFPLLALPSAWLAVALSTAAGWWARGRALLTVALLLLAVLLSAAGTLAAAWRGPAAFALDHLLGAWPGPLYDEALSVDARLLLFRTGTLALAVAVVAAAALARRWRAVPRRPWKGTAAVLLAALAAWAAAAAELRRRVLDGDRGAIERALGARLEGPACTVILAAETAPAAAAARLAECEFHAADVAAALGLPRPPRVTVFLHRSDAEKRRHVGAGATSFTKPWLREVHLTDGPLPLPILRHELVHAVAAALQPGPLGVPARRGVLVQAGLVEGLAVALEGPRGRWTNHQWSHALLELGLAPDMPALMGPAGFWGAAASRAYTSAGSLLGWLRDRFGAPRLAALYRTGDFLQAYGEPLPALVSAWQDWLRATPLPDGLLAAARARFDRPAIFQVPCAREVAALERGAWHAAAAGRTGEACTDLRRVAALTGRASPLKSAGDLLARSGDLGGAEAAYREAEAGPGAAALAEPLAAARGDLAWRRGEVAVAAERWRAALRAAPDLLETRQLEARLAALEEPRLAAAVRGWLLGMAAPGAALAALEALPDPLAAWLVARARLADGEEAKAVALLERAAAGPLPPALRAEARFLLAEARCGSGDAEAGTAGLEALATEPRSAAELERVALDLRRCDFARRAGAQARPIDAPR